jgi:hypothetical protein
MIGCSLSVPNFKGFINPRAHDYLISQYHLFYKNNYMFIWLARTETATFFFETVKPPLSLLWHVILFHINDHLMLFAIVSPRKIPCKSVA